MRWFNRPTRVFATLGLAVWFWAGAASAYTANKVWFEVHPGFYRVYVNYTVPALKEFREAFVEFTNRKEAEAFYWDLARGADFYPGEPKARVFINNPRRPDPW